MRVLIYLLVLLVLLLGLAFHARNDALVTLDLYAGVVQAPLSAMVIGALAIGALLGVLAALLRMLSMRREIGRLRAELRHAQRDLEQLRSTVPAANTVPASDVVAAPPAA